MITLIGMIIITWGGIGVDSPPGKGKPSDLSHFDGLSHSPVMLINDDVDDFDDVDDDDTNVDDVDDDRWWQR